MSKNDRFTLWATVYFVGVFALGALVLAPAHKRAEQECEKKGGVMLSRGYECVKKDAVIK